MVFSTPLFLFVYLSLHLLLYYAVPLKGGIWPFWR